MAENNNPWMGPGTYEEGQAYKFKGRDKDVEKLKLMLQQNDIVVCYGASGNGKSSLINAGISPALRDVGMFPIVITFTKDDYDNDNIDFDDVILKRIEKYLQDFEKNLREKYKDELRESSHVQFELESQYRDKQIPHSLWWKLRTETIRIPYGGYNYIPVLIFDQFEEIFGAAWKDKFFKWLECLCKDICQDDTVFNDGSNPPSRKLFKLLVSLRYEYLAELDDWCSQKTFIPQIMQNRYYLRPFSREQAMAVITEQPLSENSIEFCTTLNSIKDSILDYIDPKNNDEIEPVILSVLCYNLYNKALKKGKKELDKSDLKEIPLNQIIRNFYETEIKSVILSERHLDFFEQELVNAEGRRERIKTVRLQSIGFGEHYRSQLEKKHLIRITQINKEDYVELVHDRIADAISEKRQEASKKKRVLWSRIALLFAFVCLFCFTYWNQFWTSDEYKARLFPYMEYREGESLWKIFRGEYTENATHYQGKCHFQRNLTTLICDTSSVVVSNCPALKTLTVSSKLGEKLVLKISNCNNLEYIEIGDNITELNLSVTNCPLIQFVNLPNRLNDLLLNVNTPNDVNFPLIGNGRYVWQDGILWDNQQMDILYARSDAPEIVNPPFNSTKTDYSIKRNFREYDDTIRMECGIIDQSSTIGKEMLLKIPRNGDTLNLTSYNSILNIRSITDKDLTGIKVIKFPSSLNGIWYSVFANSPDLETIDFSACKNIDLSTEAFANCHRLKRIIFPDSAGFKNAFMGCASIQYVKLPNSGTFFSSGSFDCYVDAFEIDTTKSMFRKEEDGTITIGGDPMFADNVKYHTLNNDYCYSKNGILYDKDNVIWNIPFEIGKTLKKEFIKRNGITYYNNCNNESDVVLFPKEVLYRDTKRIVMFSFAIKPANLRELHVACSNFDERNGVDASKLLASIPQEIRQQTTLYVPYNCSWYFLNNRDFKGFKEIKEETWYEWAWTIIKYHFTVGVSFFNYYDNLWLISVLLVILVSLTMSYLIYHINKRKYGKQSTKEILVIVFKSFATCILLPAIWYVTYWFMFLSIFPLFHVPASMVFDSILSTIIIAIIAALVAVMVVYIVLYSDGFNLKGMIASMKINLLTLCQIIKNSPKKTLKYVSVILLPFVLIAIYWQYRSYSRERFLKASVEVEKALTNAANRSTMALDILYETWKDNYSIIKGETIEDKLFSVFYSKMVTEGMIRGVDTIMQNAVNNIYVLPNDRLILDDYNRIYLYNDKKDSVIYGSGGVIRVNDKGTYMVLTHYDRIVFVDLLTQKKDSCNIATSICGLHPIQPVLAYYDANDKAISFFDFNKKKVTSTHIPIDNKDVYDICYNKEGNEIAIASNPNDISIYRLKDGKWSKIREIKGKYPSFIANDYFSVIRSGSLFVWPVNKIEEDDEKRSWIFDGKDISFSKDGKFALSRGNYDVKVLDLTSSGKEYMNLEIGDYINDCCLSEDGKNIYISYKKMLVKIPILTHDQLYDLLKEHYNEK